LPPSPVNHLSVPTVCVDRLCPRPLLNPISTLGHTTPSVPLVGSLTLGDSVPTSRGIPSPLLPIDSLPSSARLSVPHRPPPCGLSCRSRFHPAINYAVSPVCLPRASPPPQRTEGPLPSRHLSLSPSPVHSPPAPLRHPLSPVTPFPLMYVRRVSYGPRSLLWLDPAPFPSFGLLAVRLPGGVSLAPRPRRVPHRCCPDAPLPAGVGPSPPRLSHRCGADRLSAALSGQEASGPWRRTHTPRPLFSLPRTTRPLLS
jgi:hypothetical protein